MQILRGFRSLQPLSCPSIVTIGTFDGLHYGHQAVIQQVLTAARRQKCLAVVVLFEPQPYEYFCKETEPKRISRLRDKVLILKQWGIDAVICCRFDAKLEQTSAEDFCLQLLGQVCRARHVFIGDDFRFGAKRRGDYALMQQQGQLLNFDVTKTSTVLKDSRRISSTWVRQAISDSDFALASQLLGRAYAIRGRVQHGAKRGRLIGFPTLNIGLNRPMAVSGVFVVQVKGLATEVLSGVANIGVRPTVDGVRRLLEVHLFEYTQTCYGQDIEVILIHKLRDEKRFDSFDALKQQIQNDKQQAIAFFAETMN